MPGTEEGRAPERGRLGVYVDTVYRAADDGSGRAFTNAEIFPFMRFVCEVGANFAELVLFGRADPGGAGADHELPGPARVVGLPYYRNLTRAWEVLRATPGTLAGMWRGVAGVDTVLVFGPYPFSLFLALFARLRGRSVVLGVRQDTMRYFRTRLPHPLAAPVLLPLWLIDRAYHLLSRRLPTLVVGTHLEHQYGGPRQGLLALRISLVRAADVADGPAPLDWAGPIELITVGRIEPEKNPLLLVEAIAELEARAPGRYRLTWVGEGKLAGSARARARELGVENRIEFTGYVPFGPELLARYRRSHVFVHVAVTEAFGQVLTEAMASGTPIVATAVGGASSAVGDGRAGVLVPPRDATALADAVAAVVGDADAREERVRHGLELARRHSLEAEAARVATAMTAGR
jgi:glycosyltransferase involved in cell wall biosynthesis